MSKKAFPSEWKKITLDLISEVIDPQPDHRAPKIVEGGFSYIGIGDIDREGKIKHEQCRKVSEKAVLKQEAAFNIDYEDIAFGKVGTVGKVVYLRELGRYAISATLVIIKPKQDVSRHFLFHLLQDKQTQDNISLRLTGTTRATLGIQQIRDFIYFIPPFPEQEKIAEILDTLDNVIAKTEAAIAKLKNVKTGLVHDLLTCGLDENGELRDPIKHPEQFKESALGLIPKDWVIRSLGDACRERGGSIQTGPFGSQLHAHDYKNSGIPIITVEHLGDNEVFHINLPLIGESDYKRLSKYILKIGDLVFSRVGSIDRCAFISKYENGWLFSGRCLRVRSNDGYLSPKFLSYQLNSFLCRRWILNHSVGSTMSCLNTSILSNLPIKVPHFEEQKAIEEKLIISDQNILNQQAYLEKLKLQKKGLMHDLLTGKKRVNHLL